MAVATYSQYVPMNGHTDWVTAIVALPDGCVFSTSWDGIIRLWRRNEHSSLTSEWESAELLALRVNSREVLALLPDDCLMAGTDNDKLVIWGRPSFTAMPAWVRRIVIGRNIGRVAAAAVLPNGCLVTGGDDGIVRVWSRGPYFTSWLSEWRCEAVMQGHTSAIKTITVLPGGRMATIGGCRIARVWHPPTSGSASLSWECEAVLGDDRDGVDNVVALPDGSLATNNLHYERTITVWHRMSYDPALLSQWRRTEVLKGHDGRIMALTMLSDGCLASGSVDRSVRVWRQSDHTSSSPGWECAAVLKGHLAAVTIVKALADGRLASAGADSTVRVWRRSDPLIPTSAWECSMVLRHQTKIILTLAVLPDGCLITGDGNGILRLWPQTVDIIWLPRRAVIAVLVMASRRGWGEATLVGRSVSGCHYIEHNASPAAHDDR